MLELAFRPDRASPEPLYRQLAGYLRGLIDAGRLPAGSRLPASRDLAGSLGLSRNTVNQAYALLADQQRIHSHVGQGTFVAEGVAALHPPPDARKPFAWEGMLAARARAFSLRPALRRLDVAFPGPRFDFRSGGVDPDALPGEDLRRAFSHALESAGDALARPADPLGWPPLREVLVRRLLARGIRTRVEELLVVTGAQQALDLLARVLLDPGDFAAIEQPGYFGAALAFRAAQAHLLPVPVDREGLDTEALARLLRTRRVKLVYATPAVQCPTGVALSEERREALLGLAERHPFPVVEDDYDGELRLDEPAIPALKTADVAGQVVCIGTFSKSTFPGLRLGYVVAPQPLLRRLAAAKLVSDLGSGLVAQIALTEWLATGGFERHVRRARRRIAERIDAALEATATSFGSDARVARPAGGNALWLELAGDVDPAALAARAAGAGIAYGDGRAFSEDESGGHCLHLSVSALAPGDVREGIARLADCVAAVRREHTTRRMG